MEEYKKSYTVSVFYDDGSQDLRMRRYTGVKFIEVDDDTTLWLYRAPDSDAIASFRSYVWKFFETEEEETEGGCEDLLSEAMELLEVALAQWGPRGIPSNDWLDDVGRIVSNYRRLYKEKEAPKNVTADPIITPMEPAQAPEPIEVPMTCNCLRDHLPGTAWFCRVHGQMNHARLQKIPSLGNGQG